MLEHVLHSAPEAQGRREELLYLTNSSLCSLSFSSSHISHVEAMAALRYGPDMEADAEKALKVLQDGGIVIIPADVGYAIVTCDEDKLEKIFMTKGRAAHKRYAVVAD